MMQKWEYWVVHYQRNDLLDLLEPLNEAGEAGWEAVAWDVEGQFVLLKRPKAH